MSKPNITIPNLKCTVFPDPFAQESKEVRFNMNFINGSRRAARKADLPLFKMARFGTALTDKGAVRHDANVLAITGTELDYDEGVVPFRDAMAAFEAAGILALGYTSPSHKREHPKWRIVLPFAEEFIGTQEQMKAMTLGAVDMAEEVTGITFPSEAKKLSQSFYVGQLEDAVEYDWDAVGDTPIDQYDSGLLQRGWLAGESGGESGGVDVAQTLNDIRTGEDIHTSQLRLSSSLAQSGMDREDIEEILYNALDASDEYGSARWEQRRADVPRVVDSALKKYAPEAVSYKLENELDFRPIANFFDLDKTPPPMEWVIEGLVPRNAITLFTGGAGLGKSFNLLEIAFRAATGQPVFGTIKTVPHRVLYINAEDSMDDFQRRAYSWWDNERSQIEFFDGKEVDPAMKQQIHERVTYYPVSERQQSLILTNNETTDRMNRKVLKQLVTAINALPQDLPILVVIDPLASFSGGEENSNESMQAMVAFCRRLIAGTDCSIIMCHHDAQGNTQKDIADGQGRGGSSLYGGVRAGFRIRVPSNTEVEETLGIRNMDPDERSQRYVLFKQTKNNYGKFVPPLMLERGLGGVLFRARGLTAEERAERLPDMWGEHGDMLLGILDDMPVFTKQYLKDAKEATGKLREAGITHHDAYDLYLWAAEKGYCVAKKIGRGYQISSIRASLLDSLLE